MQKNLLSGFVTYGRVTAIIVSQYSVIDEPDILISFNFSDD